LFLSPGLGRGVRVMARWYVFAVAALALAAPARAQDFYQPAGPGFAGVEVGGLLGAAVGGSGGVSTTGVAAGGYAGFSLQNGPIVGGVEGDVMPAAISGSGLNGKLSQNWLTSLRARGGYAFGNILAYGTIGPAWASSSFERNGFTYDKALTGYAVGAGAEVAIMKGVTARAEFRHYALGTPTYYMPVGTQKVENGNNLLILGVGAKF